MQWRFFIHIQAVMCYFEMICRILHVIAQVEKFKCNLEQHYCCEVHMTEFDDLQKSLVCLQI